MTGAGSTRIFGDVQLANLFGPSPQSCIGPDYVSSDQPKATWKPKITDGPYGWDTLTFRESNVVFPIDVGELARARSLTIPVSYKYTNENASNIYDILDSWSGEVEIMLR